MYVIQLAMFVGAYSFLLFRGFHPAYICLFMVPFQSMALINIPAVTSYLIAVQVSFLLLCILRFNEVINSLRGDIFFVVCILLTPFIISYIWNTFYFIPVFVWETELANRQSIRTSLNMSNITQMAYVIFGFALFWFFASLQLDINKIKKMLDSAIFIVVGVGALQVVSHFGGFFTVYETLFYNLDLGLKNQMYGGWKRINATFIEPSYFGFWASFTLFFYLTCFGSKIFLRSRAVQALFICGILSTTTTFYLGAVLLLGIMYMFYSDSRDKILIYSLGIFLAPFLIFFFGDNVINYIEGKAGSTSQRTSYGIELAWNAFWTSPIFGKAYGTGKAFFIHTQMLMSVGILGVIIFLAGLSIIMAKHRNVMIYIFCVILLGFGNFELTRPECWVYLGLLSNLYVNKQVELMQAKL